MSQANNAAEAEYINEITQETIEGYLSIAVQALLPIYEFVITFDQEVAAVWLRDRKFSLGAILLVSTRWCMVLLAIMSLTPVTTTSCKPMTLVLESLQLVGYVQVAVFSALRVSAIWGRNRTIFFGVFVLGLAPMVANAFAASSLAFSPEPGTCISTSELSDHTVIILELAARIPVIAADVLVLVLTWIKTYMQVMNARRTGTTASISLCLLRDGTVYFAILLALNLVELLTNRTPGGAYISFFVPTIPPILVNRFMLNLRQMDAAGDTQTAGRLSTFSAPQFRVSDSVFGNFAEPLEHGASPSRERVESPCLPNELPCQEYEHGRLRDDENPGQSLARCPNTTIVHPTDVSVRC